MAVAALITWLVAALGGFVMLGSWLSKGGHRTPRTSKLPPAVIFGHFGLAAIGLLVWIGYLVVDNDALSWVAFVLLLPVALLGFFMFARWLPTYQARTSTGSEADAPPESRFPVGVVAGHGLFAATTLVLVLLTSLGVGG